MKSKIKTLNIKSYEYNVMTANVEVILNASTMNITEKMTGFSMTCNRKEMDFVISYCNANIYPNWINLINRKGVKLNNFNGIKRTAGLQAVASTLLILGFLTFNSKTELNGAKLNDTLPPANNIYFPDNKFIKSLPDNVLSELLRRGVLYTLSINGATPIYYRPFNVLYTKWYKSVAYKKAYKHIISNGEKSWKPAKDCCKECGCYNGDSFWIKLKNLFKG